jgi:hypothetical protein
MLLFVLVFRGSRLYSQFHEVYVMLIKSWVCICLFFLANVLSALVAKAMSRHFHSISTFLRMQVRAPAPAPAGSARTPPPPWAACLSLQLLHLLPRCSFLMPRARALPYIFTPCARALLQLPGTMH